MQAREANCIFCRVIAGEIRAREVFRNDEIVAIEDVNPQAPTHILVLPVMHARNISAFLQRAEAEHVARLFLKAAEIGRSRSADGFRLVINEGSQGGQTVDHLHIHVLGGRAMSWPPG